MHGQITQSSTPFLTNYFSEHRYLTPHLAEAMVVSFDTIFCNQLAMKNLNRQKFVSLTVCLLISLNMSVFFNVLWSLMTTSLDFTLSLKYSITDRPMPSLSYLTMHMQSADQHMELLEKRDLIIEVRNQVGALLETCDISLESISRQLDMSPRQLRHQLNLAGTSLQKIINQYRKSLSRQLLSQTDETIAEIVYLTGFSEPSTFYRAFKRWEGMTPIEYRHINNHNV